MVDQLRSTSAPMDAGSVRTQRESKTDSDKLAGQPSSQAEAVEQGRSAPPPPKTNAGDRGDVDHGQSALILSGVAAEDHVNLDPNDNGEGSEEGDADGVLDVERELEMEDMESDE